MQQQQELERTQAAREQAVESRHTQQLQALAHPNPNPPPRRMAPPPKPQFHGNPVPQHPAQAPREGGGAAPHGGGQQKHR